MIIPYPEEKSNNPYANCVQPSDEAPFPPQQQNQYQAPLGPPPTYTQSNTQRDGTYQGYNPQAQAYQSQTSQTPHDKTDGEYPSHQHDVPGARYPYDQSRAGPSYALHQPTNSLSPYSQTPSAGTTPQDHPPSPNNENKGFSLASFFGTTGPPPMWQRHPAANLPYDQFPPMCLISNGKDLGKGFPEVPPPCQVRPHPFSTHDITEEDWKRFLVDIKKAGSVSGGQRIKANVIPLVTGVSLIGGFFMTGAIEKRMKAKNRSAAGDVVDHWNHYFFGPRRMEAVLCQAEERLSGRDGAAPLGDPSQRRMANDLRRRTSSCSSSSSSSSSSSDDDRVHHHGREPLIFDRRQRRAERREAKTERRQERRARRAERRARKAERRAGKTSGKHSQPYQIFIQPI